MDIMRFRSRALNGPGFAWGVREGQAIIYDSMFRAKTAKRLAQLCEEYPDADWEQHREILEQEKYDVSDPGEAA